MKPLLLIALTFCALPQFSLAQEHEKPAKSGHGSVAEKSVSWGFGLPYSLKHQLPGANLRGYYNVGEHFCIGPEFSYLRSSEEQILDAEFVMHYIIETPIVGLYPLLGANYTWEQEEGHETEGAWGFAYGGGMHRNFKHFSLFAEYSRVEGPLQDDFVSLGMLFHIHFGSKPEVH